MSTRAASRSEDSRRWDRLYQTIGGILLTVCLGLTSWGAQAAVANRERITAIEANRYTAGDARLSELETAKDLRAIWSEIARIRESMVAIPTQPPEWLKQSVDRNSEAIKEMAETLRRLETAVAKLDGK